MANIERETILPRHKEYLHILQPMGIDRFVLRNEVKFAACGISDYCMRGGFVTDGEYYRMVEVALTFLYK